VYRRFYLVSYLVSNLDIANKSFSVSYQGMEGNVAYGAFYGWRAFEDGLTACHLSLGRDQAASAKALAIAAQLTAEASTITFEAATAHSKALKAAA